MQKPLRFDIKQKKTGLKKACLFKNISDILLLYVDYLFDFRSMLLNGILHP